ncbi:hypothetical protein BFG57_16990 [Bacillus solimangrovi]|uniref:Uncharacterized protein n=2 Tax=Bacillus solimangrovi TaxID=1305675 RepID=A0A1E5LDB1_9BACI|nr:hypothetical protein BFG57_16990 [Bacillus solimangrovi]
MFFLLLSLLIGCSKERTFEEFFHKEMEAKQEGYDKDVLNSYSLVHHEQNVVQKEDAIAIRRENNIQGEQIFITYFKKENGTWYWEQTRGAEWDTPHKWSAMNELPHIYSGAISDNNITEIYAGEEQAKIIDVEGNKRYWYAVSPFKDVEVKYVRKDGTEEIIESIDYEMLEELAK